MSSNTEDVDIIKSNNIDTLIFSGGGTNGYIFCGVLKFLEEHFINNKLNITKFAGTSIGSLYATLLCMNFSYLEIIDIMYNFNYENYNKINLSNFIYNMGIDDMTGIKEYIIHILKSKNYKEDITFIQLFNITNKLLVINAVSLYSSNIHYFNYIDTPDMPIITAMLASMSVPFMFSPVEYNGDMYIDGGIVEMLICNYPPFKNIDNKDKILGFNLTSCINTSPAPINNLYIYIKQILCTLYKHYKCTYDFKHINFPLYTINFLNVDMKNEEKDRMLKHGYNILETNKHLLI